MLHAGDQVNLGEAFAAVWSDINRDTELVILTSPCSALRAADNPVRDDPVPHADGSGLRDQATRSKRAAPGSGSLTWIIAHVCGTTTVTILDDAGLTLRMMADQLGHERPSPTQDVYLGRKTIHPQIATALEGVFDASQTKTMG